MLSPKYRRYIQPFLLVLPMTGIVTGINTIIAKGLNSVFTQPTSYRWAISLLIAYPCVLFMMPISVKITNRFVKTE